MLLVPSVVLLALHLLAMQVAGAGPLIAASFDLIGVRHPICERLSRYSWYAFWIGLALGTALIGTQVLLVKRDYGPTIDALSYKLKWGVAELVVYVVSLWAYLVGWRRLRSTRWQRGCHISIGLFTATNLLYHFPTLMLLFSRMVAGRIEMDDSMDAAAYRALAFDGDVLAATVHFWLASLVAGGVTLVVLVSADTNTSGRNSESIEPSEEGLVAVHRVELRRVGLRRVGTWGASVGLAAAVSQLLIGTWLLAELPGDDQAQILGGDLWATGLMALGFFTAIGLMHELATIAFGTWNRKSSHRCAMKLLVTTIAMAGASVRLGR